jgi:hypothetical protein
MIRFLLCLLYPVLLIPLYLDWSRRAAEGQIDKMQAAVFNSPGAEAPIPPAVIVAGVGLLLGYGLWGRLLGQPGGRRWAAMLLGAPLGVALMARRPSAARGRPR